MNRVKAIIYNRRFVYLLPSLLFISGVVIGRVAEEFRFIPDYRFIYQYGKLVSLLFVFIVPFLGLAYAIMLIRQIMTSFNKLDLLHLLLSLLPLLCFSIIMLYSIS